MREMLLDQQMPPFKKTDDDQQHFLEVPLWRGGIFSGSLIAAFVLFGAPAYAVTLDKTNYTLEGNGYIHITTVCADINSPIVIYNLTSGAKDTVFYQNGCDSAEIVNLNVPAGDYSILELSVGNSALLCAEEALYYGECKSLPEFADEFLFTVLPFPGGGGSGGSSFSLLSKAQFTHSEVVSVSCQATNDYVQLYDITVGIDGSVASNGNLGIFACTQGSLSFNAVDSHSYAVIEVVDSQCVGQDYAVCSSDSFANVVNEARFIITSPFNTPSGIAQYGPNITLSFPSMGTIFSRLGTISYKAIDLNDRGKENERSLYGLAKTPVTLSYSDKIAEWNSFSPLIAPAYKVLIAENQPAEASYLWHIKDLVPGVLYRIIADVVDMAGTLGEVVSDFFTVDFEAPTFIVKTNPPTTQGKDVVISINASENLKEPPAVTVMQTGGSEVPLMVEGAGSHYEGTYRINRGYDGVAVISVSGTDEAGNVGKSILSGGTFAVGVNPPPPPRISFPSHTFVTGTSTVSVTGTVRSDTTVRLVVNGTDVYTASSSADGVFSIPHIRLDALMNHGLTVFSVSARDQTGLMSEAVPIQVKYNIAPTVSVSFPAENATVGAATPLAARATDENTDPLSFTYQIIPAGDFDASQAATSTKNEWRTVGEAVPFASFLWDSTEVEDGQYFLRIIVNDGTTETYAAPIPFSVRNTLSFFRFEDGRKTVTNLSSATIVGRAITPSAIAPRPTIKTVEYGLDGGKKWIPVQIASGTGTSEVRFSVTLTNLKEGQRGILWRVKDSRDLYGRASHSVVVDTVAPDAPIINFPSPGVLLTKEDDENTAKTGLQIRITGTAESQSTVILKAGSASMSVKAGVGGSFVFQSVEVPQRGTNVFLITAKDEAGNTSSVSSREVIYDNPPSVSILTPKPFRGLSGKGAVSWSISDADNDPIRTVVLSYRRGENAFIPLPIDPLKKTFSFDVSRLPEADDYQLRLAASDGMATGTDTVNFSVDASPPSLTSFALAASILKKGDTLIGSGIAQDSLSGIEFVEYAVAQDSGQVSFSTALLTSGFLQKNASFAFKYPVQLPDGSYIVHARAVDAAGNTSATLSRALVVDTMPPRIGSFDILSQGVRIIPDGRGIITLYRGMRALFEISLEGDTQDASLMVNAVAVPLKKDIVSGLWQATLDTEKHSGTVSLYLSAEDAMHNAVSGALIGSLDAMEYGSVTTLQEGVSDPVSGAEIQVSVLDESNGNFVPFSQQSSVVTDTKGNYQLALPQGVYEISANKSGYHGTTQRVDLRHAGFVNSSFSLEKFSGVWGFILRTIGLIF